MTRSQKVTAASLLGTLLVIITPALIKTDFNMNVAFALLIPSMVMGGVIALGINFAAMFSKNGRNPAIIFLIATTVLAAGSIFFFRTNPFYHPFAIIRFLIQAAVITGTVLAVASTKEPAKSVTAFPDDPSADKRAEILRKWTKPEGVLSRFGNVHPILGSIGVLGAVASGTIFYFGFSDIEMFLEVPPGEMAVYVLIPLGTLFYILLVTGYLDELFFWSRNKLFFLVGGGFSIPKHIVVDEKGDTIRLLSRNWDQYSFELRLREKITHKKVHKYKSSSTNSIGQRKTTTHSWDSLRVEYNREEFLEKPEKSGAGSAYDITVPPLSSVQVSRTSRQDWVLGVKVKKGIFTWFKEVYLIPANLS